MDKILIGAITLCDIEILDLLFKRGISIDEEVEYDYYHDCSVTCSLLHVAVFEQNLDSIEYLVQRGADIHKVNQWDDTPLHTACSKDCIGNSLDIVKYLVKNGAEFDVLNRRRVGRGANNFQTPLDVFHRNQRSVKTPEIATFLSNCKVKKLSKEILSIYNLDFAMSLCVINELFPDQFSYREIYSLK
jgi:Ankyrin repeats (3 copies)